MIIELICHQFSHSFLDNRRKNIDKFIIVIYKAVIHLRNGKYGLIEIKLGGDKLIEEGAKNLKAMEAKIQFVSNTRKYLLKTY